jgi:hypothetical protein
MSRETKSATSTSHGSFERRDIGVGGVLYFLLGLAVFGLITHFLMTGLYSYLEKRTEAQQAPVSPLVKNTPTDTRHLPVDYKDYLQQNFPSPQLEIDERNQLDKIRLDEAQTLSTYDYIDQKAGTIRIPINRAMDLIAQRGLPVRGQAEAPAAAGASKKKGNKQ